MQKSKYFENKTLFLQIKNIHPLKIKVLIWHMALNKFLVEVTSESQYVKWLEYGNVFSNFLYRES